MSMPIRRCAPLSALVVLLTLLSVSVQAQGFGVYSQSGCMGARGGAGVAAPCADGSAVFYNPAALVDIGSVASVGANLVALGGEFAADAGTATPQEDVLARVPHAYLSVRPNDRVAIGAGLFVPYGLRIEWPENFRGAFSGYRAELMGAYLQPTVAVRLTRALRIGAGVDAVYSTVSLDQRLDLSGVVAGSSPQGPVTFGQLGVPRPTAFASARLHGSSWSAGWHLGALLEVTDALSFGARYLSEVTNQFDGGSADFSQIATGITLPEGNPFGVPEGTPLDAILAPQFQAGGPLTAQTGSTEITYPAQAVVGFQFAARPSTRILVDYVWTDWSAYRELRIDFEALNDAVLIQDYEDTGSLRLGIELDATQRLVMRGGYVYSEAAAPDVTVTPLLPDARRHSFSAGVGGRVWREAEVHAFGSYIAQADRRGRLLPRESRALSAEELNEGEFSGSAIEVGVTLVFPF